MCSTCVPFNLDTLRGHIKRYPILFQGKVAHAQVEYPGHA